MQGVNSESSIRTRRMSILFHIDMNICPSIYKYDSGYPRFHFLTFSEHIPRHIEAVLFVVGFTRISKL